MYDRKVADLELTFVVSGKLWKQSLVMKDLESGGLWSHILGECKKGSLAGTVLKMHPSVIADWASWKTQYPETTVLLMQPTDVRYNTAFYEKPKLFLIGITGDEASKGYQLNYLKEYPVLNDEFDSRKLVLFTNPESGATWAYERTVDETTLEFASQTDSSSSDESSDWKVVDVETKSVWNPLTGVCESGEHKGKQLKQIAVVPSYSLSWKEFYPDSEYWAPPR